MKRFFTLSAIGIAMLTVVLPSSANSNLNSSRSNVYRMVYPADLVSQAQVTTMLAALEKLGPADEAKLKQWLSANLTRFGIPETRVKEIDIFLEQQISCIASAETCKGKYVKGQKGVCLCYGSMTNSTQVQRVSKASPIVIFLLSDPKQKADAFTTINNSKSNNL